MTHVHDIFVRAYVVATEKKKGRKSAPKNDDPKWPQHALVFDTETRITADQSLTFGVYRLCELSVFRGAAFRHKRAVFTRKRRSGAWVSRRLPGIDTLFSSEENHR